MPRLPRDARGAPVLPRLRCVKAPDPRNRTPATEKAPRRNEGPILKGIRDDDDDYTRAASD